MKHVTLPCLLVLCAGAASAQSSVTLFGVVDQTFAHGSGSISSRNQLANSGLASSRVGFRGREDLGNALYAGFWLEASLATDSGAGVGTNTNNQTTGGATCTVASAPGATCSVALNGSQGLAFNRLSYVNIGGSWGEVRLGRDYTPQFWNLAVNDPFFTNGVGTTQAINSILFVPTAVRASNSIGYFLPQGLGGFCGQVMYYLGENARNGAATQDDGSGAGARLGWGNKAFDVAVTTSRSRYATGDIRQSNFGGSWTMGVWKLMAEYSRDRFGAVHGKGGLVGGSFDIGAGQVRASVSTYETDAVGNPTSKKFAVGYIHNLSKRTALYATYAHVSNGGGAAQALNGAVTAAGRSSSGLDVGIKHSF